MRSDARSNPRLTRGNGNSSWSEVRLFVILIRRVGNMTDVPCVLCTVGPKLKAAAKEAEGVDWRTHLDACRKSREAVATKFPDVRSALDRIGREAKDAVDKIETVSSYFIFP